MDGKKDLITNTHYYLVHNSEKLKTTQGPDGIMQRLKMMQKDI